MKLKYLTAVCIALSLLLFGCIPENNIQVNTETAETDVTTLAHTEETAVEGSGKRDNVFGNIEEEGDFPEIPFEDFK